MRSYIFLKVHVCPAVDKLESFLKQFPFFPNAFLVGGSADFFVIEVADQVELIMCSSGKFGVEISPC